MTFPDLKTVTTPNVGTAQAAFYLNRKPNTLRLWACKGTGAIKPVTVSGRLAWPVADIKKVAGVA